MGAFSNNRWYRCWQSSDSKVGFGSVRPLRSRLGCGGDPMRLFPESDLLTYVDIRTCWLAIRTECKIFFRDSQEKNEKKVEITEFYYQQNN